MYATVILPVALYGCEILSLNQMEEEYGKGSLGKKC
jgi:hypothetical protein